jgi:hypothetical protein
MRYNICQKCLRRKRNNSKPICVICSNYKNLTLSEKIKGDLLKEYVKIISDFIYKLEIKQAGFISLENINEIIEYHYIVYERDYIGLNMKAGEQLEIMWIDLKKFITNFSGQHLE